MMKKLFIPLLLVIILILLSVSTFSGFGATSSIVLPQNVASVNLTLTIKGANYAANGISFFGLKNPTNITITNYYAGGSITGANTQSNINNTYIQWSVTGTNASGSSVTIKNTDNGTSDVQVQNITIPYANYVPSGGNDTTSCIGDEYLLYGFTSAQQMANAVCNTPSAGTGYGAGASTTGTPCSTTTGTGNTYICNVKSGNVSIVVPPFFNTPSTTYSLNYQAYTSNGNPMSGVSYSGALPLGTSPASKDAASTNGFIVITLTVNSGTTTTTTYYIWRYGGFASAYGSFIINNSPSVPTSSLNQILPAPTWPTSGSLNITIPSTNITVTVGPSAITNISLS